MIQKLIDKITFKSVTFRFSISSLFTILFLFAMTLLIGVIYYRSLSNMLDISNQIMNEVISNVSNEITTHISAAKVETEYNSYLIQSHFYSEAELKNISDKTFGIMKIKSKNLSEVESADWGDEFGNFVISAKIDVDQIRTDIVDRSKLPINVMTTYYNSNSNLTSSSTSLEKSYFFDPRERPWYKDAKLKRHTVISDPFVGIYFGKGGYWNMMVSSPVINMEGKFIGAFALKLRLDYFSKFIESIHVSENGKVFIVTESGKLLAYPNLNQLYNTQLQDIRTFNILWIAKSFSMYTNNHLSRFNFKEGNKNYIASYKPIMGTDWLIGIVVPEDDFISTLKINNILMLIIGLFIILLGILSIAWLSLRIVNPIKKLIQETENIRNFKLDDTIHVHSRVKEIMLLSEALHLMKKGLKA